MGYQLSCERDGRWFFVERVESQDQDDAVDRAQALEQEEGTRVRVKRDEDDAVVYVTAEDE
jgi:hypothetical protein